MRRQQSTTRNHNKVSKLRKTVRSRRKKKESIESDDTHNAVCVQNAETHGSAIEQNSTARGGNEKMEKRSSSSEHYRSNVKEGG